MPNLFAYVALIAWPLVSFGLFKKYPALTATFWTIVGGYLLLPVKVAIDFPLIPPMDKESISAISALIGCLFVKKIKIPLIPESGAERWLTIALLIIPFITVMNNPEPIYSLNGYKPGLTMHDALSAIINQYIMLIPFFLGMHLVKTYDDQLKIFKFLVIAGLWYSVLILFEIRMSPQLHTWVYGFFPHSFGQQFRFGGYRAVVFLGHGLLVAMFVAVILGAATILWKEKIKIYRFSTIVIIFYFLLLLLLSKTVGAFLLGVFLVLAIVWMPIVLMKRMATIIACIVIFYPLLSIFDLFPHQQLVELIADFDYERSESLAFRFFHENRLLEHAQEKFFFGWGGWGRNRLSHSITDGFWIIIFAQYGMLGFSAIFGLLVLSVFRAINSSCWINDRSNSNLQIFHALILSVVMIDQLPNASISSWLWFFVGVSFGRSNSIIKEYKKI